MQARCFRLPAPRRRRKPSAPKSQVQLQACESLTFGPLCGERVNHDPGQDIQPAAELNKISAPKAILYQPNGLKSCVET